jgi:MIP family channel proteins
MKASNLIAEFIGTFALVFIGAGSVSLQVGGLVGIAFAHGLTLLVIAFAYGHISGAHINPAVTLGLWIGRVIDATTAISYIVVQLIGGIAAGFILLFVLGGPLNGLGTTILAPGVSPIQGLVVEAILTFFLVNTVFNTAVSRQAGGLAPIAIGLTLAFSILMGGPLTGGSLNPARTLGPAIATGNFSDIWLYFAGPAVGAFVAAMLYLSVFKPKS